VENVIITGTGSYTPINVMTNDDLAKVVDTSDEWIRSRTGILERRISTGENTSDLAYKACLNALEDSNEKAENIDLIICATMSPDNFMPSTAAIVQGKLGATKAVAFDLSAACTGFVYALTTAAQFIKTGMYKKALVIGAETISKLLDWEDRATCVLFGDGAGAVVLSSSDSENSFIATHLTTDGTKGDMLKCLTTPISNTYVVADKDSKSVITMNGGDVFKFAVKTIVDNIKKVLEVSGYTMEDIKYIVPHQANIRIIDFAAKLLKVPNDKFYSNLHKFGNTSAASIGIALDELSKTGKLNKGDKLILVGFGAGMTSGAILLEWL
jgi:3-oxoacyl-[acyl-carrier-protein] synthase-3